MPPSIYCISCSSCAVACLRLTPRPSRALFKSGCDRALSWHASVCCLAGASAIAMITALTLPCRARGSSSCQLYPSLLVSTDFFLNPHICQCLKPHLGRTQVNLPYNGLRLVTLFSQSCLFKSEQDLSWASSFCMFCTGQHTNATDFRLRRVLHVIPLFIFFTARR